MMVNVYVKEKKIEDRTEEQNGIDLIKSIIIAKKELEIASRNFEYADGDLIDYYTYEIKAIRAKLDYLVKKAKSKSIELDSVNKFKLRNYEDKVI